jgi:hypothetical protein
MARHSVERLNLEKARRERFAAYLLASKLFGLVAKISVLARRKTSLKSFSCAASRACSPGGFFQTRASAAFVAFFGAKSLNPITATLWRICHNVDIF